MLLGLLLRRGVVLTLLRLVLATERIGCGRGSLGLDHADLAEQGIHGGCGLQAGHHGERDQAPPNTDLTEGGRKRVAEQAAENKEESDDRQDGDGRLLVVLAGEERDSCGQTGEQQRELSEAEDRRQSQEVESAEASRRPRAGLPGVERPEAGNEADQAQHQDTTGQVNP